ncbi:hypothetical protein M422DRAFT_55075, partial [Sphaerobolus stellatus SS14]
MSSSAHEKNDDNRIDSSNDDQPKAQLEKIHAKANPNKEQGNNAVASQGTNPSGDKPRFSVYTLREKWMLITVAGLAGLFSPLTATLYLPAIPVIGDKFHVSTELVNLTVTVYLVFQGISPMLWGTLSDRIGRRPFFMVCLLLLSVSSIGLALVPTNAYWLLLVLRCFQASGSASTIALGAGVISDIAEPAERGGFIGIYSLGPL